MVTKSLAIAVSDFGRSTAAKLSNPAISGAPEDQLRGPLETLIAQDIAALCGHAVESVKMVGETSLSESKGGRPSKSAATPA